MQFCQAHWDALRASIHDAGLGRWIAKDGLEVARRTVAQVEKTASETEAFEPLMGAHWAIVSNALNVFGIGIMADDTCPLCVTAEHCRRVVQESGRPCSGCAEAWIGFATREQRDRAVDLGLIEAA